MFAQRTVDRSLLLLKAIAVFLLAVALLAAVFPSNNTSFAQACLEWAAKLAIGIPAWFAVEFAGTKFLGLPFFARLSSPVRVAAIAAITVLAILVFMLGVSFVKHSYSL